MKTVSIGDHRLINGDITDGAIPVLMGDELADVVYSDPPWGPGNQKYWHTHNRTVPRTDWDTFLVTFCRVVAASRKPETPVFVEMGLRWVDQLHAAMAGIGLPVVHSWRIYYGRPARPNVLSLYGPRDMALAIDGLHGESITTTAIGGVIQHGAIVLDPCCGKGMTARVTHRLGGRFRGCEMNSARLSVTADWLRRHA